MLFLLLIFVYYLYINHECNLTEGLTNSGIRLLQKLVQQAEDNAIASQMKTRNKEADTIRNSN